MAASPDESPTIGKQEGEFHDALIAHFERQWNAATENAQRVSTKTQLMFGSAIAFVTIIIFNMSWTYNPSSRSSMSAGWVGWIHGLLIASSICFSLSLLPLVFTSVVWPPKGFQSPAKPNRGTQPS